MQKICLVLGAMLVMKAGFSQDSGENNLKNFRFGLKATPSMAWYKPDDKKRFEMGGLRFKFAWGLMTEFRLNKIASLATGVQIDYDGGALTFKDTSYYYFADNEIITLSDTGNHSGMYEKYRLTDRKYNITYATIPLTLKMKTNEIGYITYFGLFGLNTSVRTKARAEDNVTSTKSNTTATQQDLDITDDVGLLKFALNVGAGFEYTFSGSTALVVGVNYINGFSNVVKSESKYILKENKTTSPVVSGPLKQKATGNGVTFTVGVLF